MGGSIDLLLLDGWKEAYLPMLRLLEPQLSPAGPWSWPTISISRRRRLLLILDDVRQPGNGYVSVNCRSAIASRYRCAPERFGDARCSFHLEIQFAHHVLHFVSSLSMSRAYSSGVEVMGRRPRPECAA